MSLKAMEDLAGVEDRLRRQKADAQNAAKLAAAKAREDGEQLVAEAVRQAEAETAKLERATDEKAKAAASELARSSETERGALRSQAKKREEEAVSFVVERIVNG